MSMPAWAANAPSRGVYRSTASGRWEVYAWDRVNGTSRRVTESPGGVSHATIDPRGAWIWWSADGADGHGPWWRQPFGGGPSEIPLPGLGAGRSAGLALGATGTVIAGVHDGPVTRIHVARPGDGGHGQDPALIAEYAERACVAGLAHDEGLIALNLGDRRAVRVVRQCGETVNELADGTSLRAVRFAPGDNRLLALHERRGRPEPLIWDPMTGDQREVWLRLPGEICADWYSDGGALLIIHHHRGRTELYRYDLRGGVLKPIETERGVISVAKVRPDGTVEYAWSSSAQPPVIRSTSGLVVINPGGPAAPPSVPAEDADVEGPGGRVHALVSRPASGDAPYPAVFLLHGPGTQGDDSFAPEVAAWVDHGFAVVRANHRGSTGYGSAWRDGGRDPLSELDDVEAVRDWAVASGLADPHRLVLAGRGRGGHLALLGVGARPAKWSLCVAASPEPGPGRAPTPIAYAEAVDAPVLLLAGENDPDRTGSPVDAYAARLAVLGKEHEVYRYDAGRGLLPVEEQIRQMAAQLAFARKHLGLA
ncbi:S9 family peptidase [Bailinhaonella thermotolerans]|uniref:S9 family peptidase n=2 Tax=Bailinhaonella thermotolerans TaxID=1070861 RepID=A0A3A4B2C5_9ACTN|nr:S9 family peptidase [Bailinhaonella thermotolerans]